MLTRPACSAPRTSRLTVAATLVGLLAACGGGSDTPATPPPSAPATLSGTAAVGAPLVDGVLRVIDATGAVVADAVPLDAAGRFSAIALTGTGPWRLEACGWAAAEWTCLQSVAYAAGTSNVTPLTTAALVLASGTPAEGLMAAGAPSAAAVATAQGTLASSLATLGGGGVDFFGGVLDAGSRTGYDRLLDAVQVNMGSDGQPFVQLTPRLGSGNVFVQSGSAAQGSLSATGAAATLPLAQLEALFSRLNSALVSEAACRHATTGLASQLADDARLSFGPEPLQGAALVADVLCTVFSGREPGSPEAVGPALWGSRLMSPVLGRCDFDGDNAVCGVSLVLRDGEGDVAELGGGMAVALRAGQWRLLGDRHAVGVTASARVQRDLRIDGASTVAHYDRAFAFEVPALPGLACARVSQQDAAGTRVTLAFYKRHVPGEGEGEPDRLSLWTNGSGGPFASTDPASGNTRTSDDTWIFLPEGEAGDAAIRHFLRGGRTVTVDLYVDPACSTPFGGAATRVVVDVDGVPPVWSALPDLPWPAYTTTSQSALRNLVATAGTATPLELAWSFPRGAIGFTEGFVCTDRALCGGGGSGRVAEQGLRPRARMAGFVVQSGVAVTAGEHKMAGLYGRWRGLGVQANMTSCPAVPAGERCR
jgi:hypothetical protein